MRYVFNGVEIIQATKPPTYLPPPGKPTTPEQDAQAIWNEAKDFGRREAIAECANHGCMWCRARSKP